jgi:hypothetical protein
MNRPLSNELGARAGRPAESPTPERRSTLPAGGSGARGTPGAARRTNCGACAP